MSMNCDLHAVAPQELDRLLAEPEMVQSLCDRSLERLQSMAGLMSDPEAAARLFADPEQAQKLYGPAAADGSLHCLEKNWHGLHFLLTGSSSEVSGPLGFLIAGGTAVGDVDCGYGPARAFRPPEVTTLAEALASFPEATLRQRCTSVRCRARISMVDLTAKPPKRRHS